MGKKQLIILGSSVVVAFIIGFFIGDSSATNRANKIIAQKNSQSTSSQPNETKKEDKKEKIYKVGEEGASGNWNLKILEATESDTIQGGNSSNTKTTKEKFIVLKLQMNNISKQPVQYSADEFKLGNIKDKSQYNAAFEAIQTANSKEMIYNKNNEFISVYDDTNPNTPKQTYIIFEVPKATDIKDCILINANKGSEPVGFYLK